MDAAGIARDLLAHMVWDAARPLIAVWRNEPVDFSDVPHDVEQWARTYYAKLARVVASLDVTQLDMPMPVPWAEGGAPTTFRETILQVTSHSAFAWLWLGRPSEPALHPIA